MVSLTVETCKATQMFKNIDMLYQYNEYSALSKKNQNEDKTMYLDLLLSKNASHRLRKVQ